jgi:Tfp pilus assembly protein PilZ
MGQLSMFGERRFHERKECIVAVEINDFEGFVKGNMRNIGLGGAFVDTQFPFAQKPGQDVIITIPYQLQSKKITLKGRVTRVRSNGMGIAFSKEAMEL